MSDGRNPAGSPTSGSHSPRRTSRRASPPLQDLAPSFCDVPFPQDVLPAWLADFAAAATASTQVPDGVIPMMALGALSAACQGTVIAEPDRDWPEQAVLWIAVAQDSGERKSASSGLVNGPLRQFERQYNEDHKAVYAGNAAELKALEAAVSRTERALLAKEQTMGGSEHLQDELYNAMRALEDFEVHRPLILLSDDITPEALGTRMVEQGGNAAIVSTEGGLFSMMLGRYSGSSNLDVYLKAHSGDDHRVDRVGRKSDHIERPSLSLSLAFQPSILSELGKKPELRGTGMLARFLYAVPPPRVGHRATRTQAIPERLQSAYNDRLAGIARHAADRTGPEWLTLTGAAREALYALQDDVEQRMQDDGDLRDLRDWGSKLPGAIVRVAALLHVASRAGESTVITGEAMAAAIRLAPYLTAHAGHAFAVMTGHINSDKPRRLEQSMLRRGKGEYSVRDLKHTLTWDEDEILEAMEILIEAGRARQLPLVVGQVGRPPSRHYELRPGLAGGRWN